MSADNIEAFLRGTFIFNVDGGRFTLHKALVARKSRGLEAIMESGMKETQEGMTTLETDSSTFGRFAEYVYTGDYNAAPAVEPEPEDANQSSKGEDSKGSNEAAEKASRVEEAVHERPQDGDGDIFTQETPTVSVAFDLDDTWATTWGLPSKKKKSIRQQPEEASHRIPKVTAQISIARPIPVGSKFVANGDWHLDYLPVFLSHAQLYVFADTYEAPDLQKLTARRLEEALDEFKFSPTCATDFAALLQYVHDNTADRESETDILRIVVGNFVANNIESLLRTEIFRTLLKSDGSLGVDILSKIVHRFNIG